MSQDALLVTADSVRRQLTVMLGHPVRITVFEPESRERACRIPGILADIWEDRLDVETSEAVASSLAGAVTIEILANGSFYWGSSTMGSLLGPQRISLMMPQSLQSGQRRRYARVDLDTPVSLYLSELGRTIQADLRDLSAGGASLKTAESVPAGCQVRIAFRMGSGLFLQAVVGQVLRCAPTAEGRYALALKFDCTPEQESMISTWVNAQLQIHGPSGSA